MRLFLFILLLLPTLSFADTWKKTTKRDKMYDYNYDVIQNSGETVAVVCANNNAIVSIDFRKFVGVPNEGSFTFRFDSEEPIEWKVGDVDLTTITFSKAYYFVEGLVKSKKITTRVSSEHAFAEKTIDATGFASAFNSSRNCKDSVAAWNLKFEQPDEDASFQLINSNENAMLFIDKEFFDEKEHIIWELLHIFKNENVDNSDDEIYLFKTKVDCKNKTKQDLSISIYSNEGVYKEGSVIHEKASTLNDLMSAFVCDDKVLNEFVKFKNISSVKDAILFSNGQSKLPQNENEIEIEKQRRIFPAFCKGRKIPPMQLTQFNLENGYPKGALDKEIEGNASILLTIDIEGKVTNSEITAASNPIFRAESVAEGAKRVRFLPAVDNCIPTIGQHTLKAVFRIE